MNFWKSSKRPLTHPLIFGKSFYRFFIRLYSLRNHTCGIFLKSPGYESIKNDDPWCQLQCLNFKFWGWLGQRLLVHWGFLAIVNRKIRNINVQNEVGVGGSKAVWTMLKESDDLVSWSVPYPSIVLFHLYSVREDVKYYFANFVRKGGGSTLQIHNPFFSENWGHAGYEKGGGRGWWVKSVLLSNVSCSDFSL